MRKVKVACVQMHCSADRKENVDKAAAFTEEAARAGARLVLLPELFERPYFCQERRYEYYGYAEPTEENLAVRRMCELTKKLRVALPVSFYEKDGNTLYNSAAFVEDGEILGVYRKTHIPDDHYYQEKFYFTLATRASSPSRPPSAVWAWAYAGISGSPKRRVALRSTARNCCFSPRR